jgi:DNA-binding MarR family transcriptional regulator
MPKKGSDLASLATDELGPEPHSTPAEPSIEQVDTRYLEGLIGYNARRAALAVIEVFLARMAPYGLRPVDFSILCLITHNPGITARQLCATLGVLPPNMVGMVNRFETRGLIDRRPHPSDRRALGLHLTQAGQDLMNEAERTAQELDKDVAHKLTPQEQCTLKELLQKIYL